MLQKKKHYKRISVFRYFPDFNKFLGNQHSKNQNKSTDYRKPKNVLSPFDVSNMIKACDPFPYDPIYLLFQ